MRLLLWQIVLVVCLLPLTGCMVLQRGTTMDIALLADHVEELNRRGSIVVLKPQIDYSWLSFADDPVALTVEQSQIQQTLLSALRQSMQSQGFVFAVPSNTYNDRGSAFLTRRMFSNYLRVMNQRNYADDPLPSLGPRVNLLSANSDFLLLSRYSGAEKSAGQHNKEIITASLRSWLTFGMTSEVVVPQQFGELELALVDGISGQIIWSGYITSQPQHLAVSVQQLLHGINIKIGSQ